MDTSEGAQCTVTCMGGAIGEGTFICENGIWVGDLTCQLPPHFSQGQFDIINPDFWNPNPGPSLQTGRTCANSVSGIVQGSSLCMDTSEGAQCTVTCMGGAIGEGTFICE